MTSAIIALQEALVARLDQSSLFSGVYHDAPARARFPYAVLNCSDERDWSCKGRRGREIILQLVLWDEQPSFWGEMRGLMTRDLPRRLSSGRQPLSGHRQDHEHPPPLL